METPTGRGKRLPLQEEVFLLCLRGSHGRAAMRWPPYTIGAALLGELLLGGRIELKKELLGTRVEVADAKTPSRDRLLNECLQRLRDSRTGSVAGWIGRFGRMKKLKHRVGERLRHRGVLRVTRGSFLLFSWRNYAEIDGRWKRDIIERLRYEMRAAYDTGDGARLDQRTLLLLSLANRGGLLGGVMGRQDRRAGRYRLRRLAREEPIGRALKWRLRIDKRFR